MPGWMPGLGGKAALALLLPLKCGTIEPETTCPSGQATLALFFLPAQVCRNCIEDSALPRGVECEGQRAREGRGRFWGRVNAFRIATGCGDQANAICNGPYPETCRRDFAKKISKIFVSAYRRPTACAGSLLRPGSSVGATAFARWHRRPRLQVR